MSEEITKLFKQLHKELGLSINEYEVDIILKKAIEAVQQLKAIKSDFLTFCNIGVLSASDIPSLNAELAAVVQEANDQFTLEPYDIGPLDNPGSADLEWWQKYICDALDRAHEWYEAQVQGV